jgi:hypothetical protein
MRPMVQSTFQGSTVSQTTFFVGVLYCQSKRTRSKVSTSSRRFALGSLARLCQVDTHGKARRAG